MEHISISDAADDCRLWPWCKLLSVCRIYVSRRRCVGSRQIRVLLLWRVVWGVEGGGGLPVRRHSFGGHRVKLWRASDWLKKQKNDKNQLKVKQSRQTRVCTWAVSGQKQVQSPLDQWQGSWGAFFT